MGDLFSLFKDLASAGVQTAGAYFSTQQQQEAARQAAAAQQAATTAALTDQRYRTEAGQTTLRIIVFGGVAAIAAFAFMKKGRG